MAGSPSVRFDYPPPAALYHYTDAGGLLGIIEQRVLRATHARYLNDAREVVQGAEIVASTFRTGLAGHARHARYIIDRTVAEFLQPDERPTWLASFSALPDDLSQWRAYSAHGGFVIGFAGEPLAHVLDAASFRLAPCAYNAMDTYTRSVADMQRVAEDNPQMRAWDRDDRGRRSPLAPNDPLTDDEKQAADRAVDTSNLVAKMRYEAAQHKHQSFKAEQEWRAIRVGPVDASAYRFRPRGGGIVPYVEIPLPASTLPIASIRIAPGAPANALEALHLFVERYRDRLDNVACLTSASPYRNT